MTKTDDDTAYPLWWQPSQDQIDGSILNRFRKALNATYKVQLETYEDIHAFSVDRLDDFWSAFWEWSGVRYQRKFTRVLSKPASQAKPADLVRFFDGARLNVAENLLFPLHPKNTTACMPHAPRNWPHDSKVAIHEYGEAIPGSGKTGAQLYGSVTWGHLRQRVAELSTAFRRCGLQSEDRVAYVAAHTSNPMVAYLACLATGCIFSALPTDAGPSSIYGRLSQVKPRLIITDDLAYYNGKRIDVVDRVAKVVDELLEHGKAAEGLLDVVCVPNRRDPSSQSKSPSWKAKRAKIVSFDNFISSVGLTPGATGKDSAPLEFDSLPFNHPALIVFSSGTTGEPKSICHSAGGMMINCKKEFLLHHEMVGNDAFLQVTTCGWIMWLATVMKLLTGCSLVTYDGSPMYPSALVIPEVAAKSGIVTGIGLSPRLLSEMEREARRRGYKTVRDNLPMPNLRLVTTTGAPLNPQNTKFFYESLTTKQTRLESISGGTDLAGVLVGGSGLLPVRGHLIGTPYLGVDLRILDPLSAEDCGGTGEPGELMMAKPLPSQPLYFWGDQSEKEKLHEKYVDSYFRRFEEGPAVGFWAQGDFISRHKTLGGYEIHGRSDGVLNPSGVRFGSAEIYSVVETDKFPFVADSIAVGQRRKGKDDDEIVLLFVKCTSGQSLDEERKNALAQAIRTAYSARHVPKHIFQVRDIPVTANGKKTELAVKAIVCGNTAFKPSTATANPESLDEYRQYADIEAVLARSRPSKL